jgi:hypothetical protein
VGPGQLLDELGGRGPAGARHVVVLRRRIKRDVVLTHALKDKQ